MMPAGTRMRRSVEQLLKETAELREHLHQGTDVHEPARLQRQFRSKGNASPAGVPLRLSLSRKPCAWPTCRLTANGCCSSENPPVEIALGVIGRFWAGENVRERLDAADFAAFDRPGLAKIAGNFSLRPYGGNQTLVPYECRTRGTDPKARRGFLRYWRVFSPFIGVVLRAQLRIVDSEARRRPHPPKGAAILSKP
jgi:hypothetical protein